METADRVMRRTSNSRSGVSTNWFLGGLDLRGNLSHFTPISTRSEHPSR
jgi:hypothetical protein